MKRLLLVIGVWLQAVGALLFFSWSTYVMPWGRWWAVAAAMLSLITMCVSFVFALMYTVIRRKQTR